MTDDSDRAAPFPRPGVSAAVFREGDVLLVASGGAYGHAMSSSYNLREPAAERLLPPR